MSTANVYKEIRDGEFPVTWRGMRTGNGFMLAYGEADPSDQDYAPGCIHINSSDGAVKRNSGTQAAAVWTSLGGAAGVATAIANGATLNDAGGFDAVLAHTTQTVGSPTLTVPDFANVDDTYAFLTLAQDFDNKTFFDDTCRFVDGTSVTRRAEFDCSGITLGQTRVMTFPDFDGTLATLAGVEEFANKTLTEPTINGATLSVASAGANHMGIACGNALGVADRVLTITLDSDAAHALTTPEGLTTAILAGYAGVAAQGEILFFNNAGAWERLGVGTAGEALITAGGASDVYWGSPGTALASALTNTVTCEAGGDDYTLDFGVAGGAYTLTIPAVGGARTFAFINEVQTFTAAQSFDSGTFLISDDDQSNYLTINWEESEGAADRALDFVMNGGDRIIDLTGNLVLGANLTTDTGACTLSMPAGGATMTLVGDLATAGGAFNLTLTMTAGTDVTLPTTGTLSALNGDNLWTNTQTFGKADIHILDENESHDTIINNASDLTGDQTWTITLPDAAVAFTLTGDFIRVGAHSLTLTTTGGTDVEFPTTGTLATLAGAETFTNKTYDCLGAGNVLTNLNGDELDPITPADAAQLYGVPFLYTRDIVNCLGAAATAVDIETNAPFKFRIIDVWVIETSANGGTWTLHKGTNGAVGAAITDTVASTGDKDVVHCGEIDHDNSEIALAGDMCVKGDGADQLDIQINILCIRID